MQMNLIEYRKHLIKYINYNCNRKVLLLLKKSNLYGCTNLYESRKFNGKRKFCAAVASVIAVNSYEAF